MQKKQTRSINIFTLTIPLTLIFLILKLASIIGWSWVWIVSPLWAPYAVLFGLTLLLFTLGQLVTIVGHALAGIAEFLERVGL